MKKSAQQILELAASQGIFPIEKATIAANLDNITELNEHLVYLWERWQDEKEYEDFEEYIANLELVASEKGFELISLGNRPFKAIFKGEEGFQVAVTLKAKGRKISLITAIEPLAAVKKKKEVVAAAPAIEEKQEPVALPTLTDTEALVLRWIVTNEFQDGSSVVGCHVWSPEAEDFGGAIKKRSLPGVVASLSKKGCIDHASDSTPLNGTGDGRTSDTVAITQLGLNVYLALPPARDMVDAYVKLEPVEEIQDQPQEDVPSIHELEERINDLPTNKLGRGFANAGKKYDKSGVRVEEFKIGKEKVKKGDKLFFRIGKIEVCGVFSHLNKCVHCPDGYAVIRFEGKNYERRQSRVTTQPTPTIWDLPTL